MSSATDAPVTYDLDDRGIVTLTLDRADDLNPISPPQRDRLIDLLDQASSDLHVRCVVITARGRGFCTGADLRHQLVRPPRPEGAPDDAVGDMTRMINQGAQRLIAAVMDCEKPVIAGVNGIAAGIGAHLALACDFVLAAESSRFIEVFVRRGIGPDGGGAYLLPRLVGLRRAKELVMLGDDLSATEAAAMGLINRCVPDDELQPAVEELATRLASGPTRALAMSKALLNRAFDHDRAESFSAEAISQELVLRTDDASEGMRSFAERRAPRFNGW